MIINHNISALNAHRQLGANQGATQNSLEKLSSGLRINKAGDDAAGLAISEKMRGQIRGLEMASKNAQDGISLIQTAEGALNETHAILQRMRELAVQAGNDTNTPGDREEMQKELNQLTSEINRIGNTTEFNTQKLLNGQKDSSEAAVKGKFEIDLGNLSGTTFELDGVTISGLTLTGSGGADLTAVKGAISGHTELGAKYSASEVSGKLVLEQKTGSESTTAPTTSAGTFDTLTAGQEAGAGLNFQIGANQNQSLTLEIADMRADALGLTNAGTDAKFGVTDGTSNDIKEQALDITSHDNAAQAVTTIQAAIDTVSSERSKLGAVQNRLDHTINNLGTSAENLTAAESRIRDVDMAKEMMEFTKNNILSQAAQSMLAQANQQPQGVLQLLR